MEGFARIILWFLYGQIIRMVTIEPYKAENPHESGNNFTKYTTKITDISIWGLYQFYHIFLYYGTPLSWFEYILFTVFIAGVALRAWAYYELGKFFTFEMQIHHEHHIISTGPYKHTAHPGYLGLFVVIVCSIMFYMPPLSWFSVLVNILVLWYVTHRFYYGIKNEEEMMRGKFGIEYMDYRKKVI